MKKQPSKKLEFIHRSASIYTTMNSMTNGNIFFNTRFLSKWFYLLLLCFASHAMESSESFKIINWNVLYGFNHHQSVKEGSSWIAKQQPDVVALQELNGISEEQLGQYSPDWHHPHAVTHKETGFPVGLTSKEPIQVIERIQKGGHHGYLHCKTYGIHFFVVHFWPGVFFEINQVMSTASQLLKDEEKVIILGDFNGCSRNDASFLKTNASMRKIDYAFVDKVEAAGFLDIVYKHDPNAKISCPSPITIPKWTQTMEELKMKQYRIDFIFADSILAKQSISGTISRDKEIDTISDHYPVIVELKK
ncbi:endonuclease/exonuclease/phosphatase family protein [bacterium]|nr:endonuclease/exonuclease/phosphatase family protein [bacterium]